MFLHCDPRKRQGDRNVPRDVRPPFLMSLRHVPMYYSEEFLSMFMFHVREGGGFFLTSRVGSVLCVVVAGDTHASMVVHSAAPLEKITV